MTGRDILDQLLDILDQVASLEVLVGDTKMDVEDEMSFSEDLTEAEQDALEGVAWELAYLEENLRTAGQDVGIAVDGFEEAVDEAESV
jgi:hypothetical protein